MKFVSTPSERVEQKKRARGQILEQERMWAQRKLSQTGVTAITSRKIKRQSPEFKQS